VDHYIDMKDAFVASNSKQVSDYAKSTSQKLKNDNLDGLVLRNNGKTPQTFQKPPSSAI